MTVYLAEMCIFHLIFAAVFFNATTALVHCCWRHCHCQHNFRHPFAVAPQWFPYIMSFEENYTVAACIKLLVFVQSKWMRFRMAERLQVKFRWHADFFVQQPPAKKGKYLLTQHCVPFEVWENLTSVILLGYLPPTSSVKSSQPTKRGLNVK